MIIYIIYKDILKLSKKIQLNNDVFKLKKYHINSIKNSDITLSIKTIYLCLFNLINLLMNYLKSIINLKASLNVFIINTYVILIRKTS